MQNELDQPDSSRVSRKECGASETQHVDLSDLDAAYRAMALEEHREAEALEWAEATINDFDDEPQ